MIAAKAATAPGYYYIGFGFSGTTDYKSMRPLFVVVKNEKCSVGTSGDVMFPSGFKVPVAGGKSLPYVVGFEKCMPETDV